jgi:hypothetical protein
MTFSNDTVLLREISICWELVNWIYPTITDSKTRHLNLRVQIQMLRNSGDVMASKRFSSKVEIVLHILWVFFIESSQELFEIFSYVVLIPTHFLHAVCKREACTKWLINKKHICIFIPSIVIENHLDFLIGCLTSLIVAIEVWALFSVSTKHARTTGTSIQPND